MTDAREIIAQTLGHHPGWSRTVDAILAALTAAGFRIVGPDEAREADLRDFVEGIEDPVLRRFAEDKLSRALKEKRG